MAAKKKTPSAADFRKAEEASKKKPSIQTTATYKGQKVNWQTPKPVAGNTVRPAQKLELKSSPKMDELQNTLRSIAVGGPILKAATGKIARVAGQKVSTVVEEAAWKAASKGLGASGAGGKVKTVTTPMGKTLGSSSIGSPAQQAARMNNLAANAEKIAYSTSAEVAGKAIRGINSAGKVVRVGAAGALLGKTIAPKKKKK
jgi:hypothetical protein